MKNRRFVTAPGGAGMDVLLRGLSLIAYGQAQGEKGAAVGTVAGV
jgi:hypothetical protein